MQLLTLISLVISLVSLSPTLIKAQPFIEFPPVARVNAPYTHSFAQSTLFPAATSEHEASTFNFTVNQIPSWLSMEVSTSDVMDPVLTFSGLPVSTDAQSSWVRIVRTASSSDYNYTRGFRMSVSDRQSPTLGNSLYNQLIGTDKSNLAVMSSVTPFAVSSFVAGVQLPATWSFSLGLRSNLFNSSSSKLYYSATLDNGQPLPAWLGFDNRTITFYGNAPSLDSSSTPQTLNVTVGCTDYPNTPPSMTDVFVIVVTPGRGKTLVLGGVNATVATEISYDLRSALRNAMLGNSSDILTLDGVSVTVADTKNSSTWLSLDSSSWLLSGTVPGTYVSYNKTSTLNVPISLENTTIPTAPFFIANATVPIHIYPYSFSFSGKFNVTLSDSLQLGDSFTVDLSRWISRNGTIHFDVEDAACPVVDTLYYDGQSHSLKGSIPSTLSGTDVRSCLMEFSVQDLDTEITSTSMLNLFLPSGLYGNGSKSSRGTGSHGLPRGGMIALAVLGSLLALIAILAVLFCLRHRSAALFKRKPVNENEARKQEKDDMDFVDIIRDSYSRQYERYRSYRQSRDTAATVVGSMGGKVDKDKEPIENKPTPPSPSPRPNGGSSPGRLDVKVLPVLGR
ncbi:hypothetical protein FRB90_007305, partial [Tulasnella sp. 427]